MTTMETPTAWSKLDEAVFFLDRLRREHATLVPSAKAFGVVPRTDGLSWQELAERASITREYIRRLEAGRQDPTIGTLQRLAKALRVKATKLVE